jgi:hypothetical protein
MSTSSPEINTLLAILGVPGSQRDPGGGGLSHWDKLNVLLGQELRHQPSRRRCGRQARGHRGGKSLRKDSF